MGRRELRDELQSTWLVHEPRDLDGNRHTRRTRATLARRASEAAVEIVEAYPPASSDSAVASGVLTVRDPNFEQGVRVIVDGHDDGYVVTSVDLETGTATLERR